MQINLMTHDKMHISFLSLSLFLPKSDLLWPVLQVLYQELNAVTKWVKHTYILNM